MSGYVPNIPRATRDAELRNVEPTDHHALQWAQYVQYGQRPSAKPATTEVALRIGVFFDGTGNNATNTALGERCGAHHPIEPEDLDAACKPYMADPDSSYGNDITNIRKLHDLYPEEAIPTGESSRVRLTRRIYVDGIGTRAGGKDSLLGAALGRGDTGVVSRVQEAFDSIERTLCRLAVDVEGCQFTSVIFDVFGFSRGAAAARHFVNEVASSHRSYWRAILTANKQLFSLTFIDDYKRDVDIGFIGLFDTVASVGGISNAGNVRSPIAPGVRLHLPAKTFPDVVHLVARDEWRANFALNSIAPDHMELVLPGAHSDIGGGYLSETQEHVLVSPMQALTVSTRTNIKATSIYQDAVLDRAKMIAKGWPASMLEVVTPEPIHLPIDPQDRLAPAQKRVFAAVRLKRPVRGELSRLYLRLMHKLAAARNVPFMAVPESGEYLIPADLSRICASFMDGTYSLTGADEKLLRERYIHFSGHWSHPFGKSTSGGVKLLYINSPTADLHRVVHPHVPDRSLIL